MVKSFDSSFDFLNITFLTRVLPAQMHFLSAAAVLLILALSSPAEAGKCPRVCSCDATKLTVACVGKNLTEVPPTVDEVNERSSESFLFHTAVRSRLNDSCGLSLHSHCCAAIQQNCSRGLLFISVLSLVCQVFLGSILCSVLLLSQITVKLDLRNNNLQQLSRGAFVLTPYLTHLNLQRCNIIKVKEGAFRTLGRVVSLNLAYNKIDILYQVSGEGKAASLGRLS